MAYTKAAWSAASRRSPFLRMAIIGYQAQRRRNCSNLQMYYRAVVIQPFGKRHDHANRTFESNRHDLRRLY